MTSPEQAYYRSPAVRRHALEYCGSRNGTPSDCTAAFLVFNSLATSGLGIPDRQHILPPVGIDRPLAEGVDLFRSLWDRGSTIAIFDVDYQNSDFPHLGLAAALPTLARVEPVYQSVREELAGLGIDHISVMTGQGYHFAWGIPDGSELDGDLQSLSTLPLTLEAKYEHDRPFTAEGVPPGKGRAHAGMGLLMEYLAHRVLRRVYARTDFPTVVTALAVGRGSQGREAVSLDLSAYGDPLFMRYSRCCFSLYHKLTFPGFVVACLPRGDMPLQELLEVRADLSLARRYAETASGAIPSAVAGTSRLMREYLVSDLRRFHVHFEAGWQDDPRDWPRGYDVLDTRRFPPCVSWPLRCPNSALAEPTNMQNVARVLVASGWHPRSVAGLVRSKFERDYGWGVNWLYYDAAARADFYVRLFCGMVATGMDDLRDLNCISHQEKGYCPRPWCGFNLADYRGPLQRALS